MWIRRTWAWRQWRRRRGIRGRATWQSLLYEEDSGPDVYVRMDTVLASAPLLPMPTVVPPPIVGSCERRRGTFHAAQVVNEHRVSHRGQQQALELAVALERFELQPLGSVAWDLGLDAPMLGGHV